MRQIDQIILGLQILSQYSDYVAYEDTCITVSFQEKGEIPIQDIDLLETLNWKQHSHEINNSYYLIFDYRR